jgi:hypothetical protein
MSRSRSPKARRLRGPPKADAEGGPSSAEDEPQNKECAMRIFVAAIAAIAIAAAPCAWDSDPRDFPALVALFANQSSLTSAYFLWYF